MVFALTSPTLDQEKIQGLDMRVIAAHCDQSGRAVYMFRR